MENVGGCHLDKAWGEDFKESALMVVVVPGVMGFPWGQLLDGAGGRPSMAGTVLGAQCQLRALPGTRAGISTGNTDFNVRELHIVSLSTVGNIKTLRDLTGWVENLHLPLKCFNLFVPVSHHATEVVLFPTDCNVKIKMEERKVKQMV